MRMRQKCIVIPNLSNTHEAGLFVTRICDSFVTLESKNVTFNK